MVRPRFSLNPFEAPSNPSLYYVQVICPPQKGFPAAKALTAGWNPDRAIARYLTKGIRHKHRASSQRCLLASDFGVRLIFTVNPSGRLGVRTPDTAPRASGLSNIWSKRV